MQAPLDARIDSPMDFAPYMAGLKGDATLWYPSRTPNSSHDVIAACLPAQRRPQRVFVYK